MALRFMDGWDLTDYARAPFKYSLHTSTGVEQGDMVTGRDGFGQAWWIFNSSFGAAEYTVNLGARNRWNIGMDLQFQGVASNVQAWTAIDWYQAGTATTTPFSLAIRTDGRMDIKANGIAIAATTMVFVVGQWYTIELQLGNGLYELRVDGVNVAHGANAAFVGFTRFVHRNQDSGVFGPKLDNYYILDDAAGLTGFQGRCRITSVYPLTSPIGVWLGSSAGTLASLVADHSGVNGPGYPDGESTYIVPRAVNDTQLFLMQKPLCYGAILALSANFFAKRTLGGQILQAQIRNNAGLFQIGGNQVLDNGLSVPSTPAWNGYRTYQVIAETNPATSTIWKDQAIGGNFIGPRSAGPGNGLHLSQFYLEKLVSLDPNRPFDCGGGPYLF